METIEDTMAAEDSEEVTLCCSIGGYGDLNMLQCLRELGNAVE